MEKKLKKKKTKIKSNEILVHNIGKKRLKNNVNYTRKTKKKLIKNI